MEVGGNGTVILGLAAGVGAGLGTGGLQARLAGAEELCFRGCLPQELETLALPPWLTAAVPALLLGGREPGEVDGALEAHVDRNRSFDDIPMAAGKPEACSLLLMLVRQGEAARRMLPMAPIVSARSFAERAWPYMLATSDLGLNGK